jgi:phage terminase small subunit
MGRKTSAAQRKRIEEDLSKQLKDKDVKGTHYEDLIQDYLKFWDFKNKLIEDIDNIGVKILSAQGYKSNPLLKALNDNNGQMLKILSELGLKAAPDDDGDDGEW